MAHPFEDQPLGPFFDAIIASRHFVANSKDVERWCSSLGRHLVGTPAQLLRLDPTTFTQVIKELPLALQSELINMIKLKELQIAEIPEMTFSALKILFFHCKYIFSDLLQDDLTQAQAQLDEATTRYTSLISSLNLISPSNPPSTRRPPLKKTPASITIGSRPTLDVHRMSLSSGPSSGRRGSEELDAAEDDEADAEAGSSSDTESPSLYREVHNPYEEQFRVESKSSIFGISDDDRRELLDVWDKKLQLQSKIRPEDTHVGAFYEEFWKIWPVMEPLSAVFDEMPLPVKSLPISNIIITIMKALTEPMTAVDMLEKLSTFHLVMGLEHSSLRTYAKALSVAGGKTLGLTPKLQEALYNLVAKFGDIIVSGYDNSRKGSLRRVFVKSGGKWRRLVAHLNHEALVFYHDGKLERVYSKLKRITFERLDDVDNLDLEDMAFAIQLNFHEDKEKPLKPLQLGFETKVERDKWRTDFATRQRGLKFHKLLDKYRIEKS